MRRVIKAIVFDVDGTLTVPSLINFARMRERIACPPGVDILDHCGTDAARHAVVIEEELAAELTLMPDVFVLEGWLSARPHLKRALLTRNNSTALARTMSLLGPSFRFDAALARDWGGKNKPHEEPLLHLSQTFECLPSETVMVGDSLDDVECARRAGAIGILIGDPTTDRERAVAAATHRVDSLTGLTALLDVLMGRAAAQHADL